MLESRVILEAERSESCRLPNAKEHQLERPCERFLPADPTDFLLNMRFFCLDCRNYSGFRRWLTDSLCATLEPLRSSSGGDCLWQNL